LARILFRKGTTCMPNPEEGLGKKDENEVNIRSGYGGGGDSTNAALRALKRRKKVVFCFSAKEK